MKTQGEERHERFIQTGEHAREMADDALHEIDAALKDEEELRETLEVSVQYGTLTELEADEALRAYHRGRFGGAEEMLSQMLEEPGLTPQSPPSPQD